MAQRRKMEREPGEPGGEFNTAARRMAALLKSTYDIALREHTNTLKSQEHVVEAGRFTNDLGEMPSARRARANENIEDSAVGKTTGKEKGTHIIWLKLAELCIGRGFDPELYIRAQFTMLGTSQNGDYELFHPPQPQSLREPAAIRNYYEARRVESREIIVAFDFQKTKFRSLTELELRGRKCKGSEDAWARVLTDEDVELSALFRYCVAVNIANDKKTADRKRFRVIADDYAIVAALQYVPAAEEYNEIWKKWIPEHFSEDAKALYRKYHGAKD